MNVSLYMRRQLGRRAESESEVEKGGDAEKADGLLDGAATLQVRAHEQQGLGLVPTRAMANANAMAQRWVDGEEERNYEL